MYQLLVSMKNQQMEMEMASRLRSLKEELRLLVDVNSLVLTTLNPYEADFDLSSKSQERLEKQLLRPFQDTRCLPSHGNIRQHHGGSHNTSFCSEKLVHVGHAAVDSRRLERFQQSPPVVCEHRKVF